MIKNDEQESEAGSAEEERNHVLQSGHVPAFFGSFFFK